MAASILSYCCCWVMLVKNGLPSAWLAFQTLMRIFCSRLSSSIIDCFVIDIYFCCVITYDEADDSDEDFRCVNASEVTDDCSCDDTDSEFHLKNDKYLL